MVRIVGCWHINFSLVQHGKWLLCVDDDDNGDDDGDYENDNNDDDNDDDDNDHDDNDARA